MANRFHAEILKLIQEFSGKPKHGKFLNRYMGNDHVRYAITNLSLPDGNELPACAWQVIRLYQCPWPHG